MPDTLETILYALGGGLLVAILTGLILGRDEKMRRLPGGSLASGLAIGALVAPGHPLKMALGAVCGLIGWACARPFFRPKKD